MHFGDWCVILYLAIGLIWGMCFAIYAVVQNDDDDTLENGAIAAICLFTGFAWPMAIAIFFILRKANEIKEIRRVREIAERELERANRRKNNGGYGYGQP